MFNSFNDVSYQVASWEAILDYLSPGEEISDSLVWEKARESEDLPHLGNIYQDLLLSRITDLAKGRGLELSYYVNALDTRLYHENDSISDLNDFLKIK